MRVEHVPCGGFVNESERKAFDSLAAALKAEPGDGHFVIYTNLAYAVTEAVQADEIDIVVVGSRGLQVIEVKHWDWAYFKSNRITLGDEADRITSKTKKIASLVRREYQALGKIIPIFIFTKEKKFKQDRIRGTNAFSLPTLKANVLDVLDSAHSGFLTTQEITHICKRLAPRSAPVLSGEFRAIGRIVDLKRLSHADDRFHRVYQGRDSATQDRVIFHIYDLSASLHPDAERLARREFDVIQQWQKSPYLPRLIDSFQPLPNYPGELYFFTLADSDVPSLAQLAPDTAWAMKARLSFAVATLNALDELHHPSDAEIGGVLHRTISPDIVRVCSNTQPLFFGWQWARMPERQTISTGASCEADPAYVSPEVREGGLGCADIRSDVYSMCASLCILFEKDQGDEAVLAKEILRQGLADDPSSRPSLQELCHQLESLAGVSHKPVHEIDEVEPPAALQWVDGSLVKLGDGQSYQVLGSLGSGGTGKTIKLQQLSPLDGEDLGTYVAKIVVNPDLGKSSLTAYMRARPHTKHANLGAIYWTNNQWSPNDALAILEWIEGTPLGDFSGVIELYAEDLGENDTELLLLGWLKDLCSALAKLHEAGLVHGDVSPSNIIVSGAKLTFIDYDLVTPIGETAAAVGTPPYAGPNIRQRRPVSPSDDIFALAVSFYCLIMGDRDPFIFDGVRDHGRGLSGAENLRERFPRLSVFLDRAVSIDPSAMLPDGSAACAFLTRLIAEPGGVPIESSLPSQPRAKLTQNIAPWRREILKAYPASRLGNTETRGLDSAFAFQTYVPTRLDDLILEQIHSEQVSLVILCGNAGDGKTAFLQHLAEKLGIERKPSSERVWDAQLPNGVAVKANLDGAASWREDSANDLLTDIFAPFHNGDPKNQNPPRRLVHLVAVNDGRLLEWIEWFDDENGASRLTRQLAEALEARTAALDLHVRLIELNNRSLVGSLRADQSSIASDFVDALIDRLVGGDEVADAWGPCVSCSAQYRCVAWRSARMLGAGSEGSDRELGRLYRERLTFSLQAVHLRNEVHITTRELKGALSYVLFGPDDCEHLHRQPDLQPTAPWDLAFDPNSPLRQGAVLRELALLDPGIEAHPRIDRYLRGRGEPSPDHGAPRYPELAVASARRRAYFEWTGAQIEAVGGSTDSLTLAGGQHLRKFRDLPVLTPDEQAEICKAVCNGLARLEDLPLAAFDCRDVVPIRIVPRTPTETAFWVQKTLSRFRLVPEKFISGSGFETLHRYLTLVYCNSENREEKLTIPFGLFALLLELHSGVQLIDTFSDDVFSNLIVFTQRLAQEDEHRLIAWSPAREDRVFEIGVEHADVGQVLFLSSTAGNE